MWLFLVIWQLLLVRLAKYGNRAQRYVRRSTAGHDNMRQGLDKGLEQQVLLQDKMRCRYGRCVLCDSGELVTSSLDARNLSRDLFLDRWVSRVHGARSA